MLTGNNNELAKAAEINEYRVDNVLRAFDSEINETPKERFDVVTSSSNAAVINSVFCIPAIVFIREAVKAHYSERPILIWCILLALLVGIAIFANISVGKRKAVVREGSITIKNRSYSRGQIDSLKGFDMSHVALYSDGKRILKVPMTDECCAELVKWAKASGISTEHVFTDDSISPLKKILLTAAAIMIFIVVAAAVIYFGLKI